MLQSQRENIGKPREELRKARSDHDELSLRNDDDVRNWKKVSEWPEAKIDDVSKAYDSSVAAYAEQQSQIVALHSQVRDLRNTLNDASRPCSATEGVGQAARDHQASRSQ